MFLRLVRTVGRYPTRQPLQKVPYRGLVRAFKAIGYAMCWLKGVGLDLHYVPDPYNLDKLAQTSFARDLEQKFNVKLTQVLTAEQLRALTESKEPEQVTSFLRQFRLSEGLTQEEMKKNVGPQMVAWIPEPSPFFASPISTRIDDGSGHGYIFKTELHTLTDDGLKYLLDLKNNAARLLISMFPNGAFEIKDEKMKPIGEEYRKQGFTPSVVLIEGKDADEVIKDNWRRNEAVDAYIALGFASYVRYRAYVSVDDETISITGIPITADPHIFKGSAGWNYTVNRKTKVARGTFIGSGISPYQSLDTLNSPMSAALWTVICQLFTAALNEKLSDQFPDKAELHRHGSDYNKFVERTFSKSSDKLCYRLLEGFDQLSPVLLAAIYKRNISTSGSSKESPPSSGSKGNPPGLSLVVPLGISDSTTEPSRVEIQDTCRTLEGLSKEDPSLPQERSKLQLALTDEEEVTAQGIGQKEHRKARTDGEQREES